jgi:hypothetical protein
MRCTCEHFHTCTKSTPLQVQLFFLLALSLCSQHIPGWARGVHPLLLEALAACEVDVPGKGRVALRDLTTREVVTHAIKPWTQSKRPASYVEVVNSGEQHPCALFACKSKHKHDRVAAQTDVSGSLVLQLGATLLGAYSYPQLAGNREAHVS